jgi:hypothetical protein
MREWVVLEPRASEDGERLVDEAFTYVAALGKRSA